MFLLIILRQIISYTDEIQLMFESLQTDMILCILSDWNKLLLRNIYIPTVGVAMTMCRMIRYC